LKAEGHGPVRIARMLNTSPQSVCRWMAAYRRGGAAALSAIPPPGRPYKLNARRRRALVHCLLKGAAAFGFATDLWTCRRIAKLIEQRYGVRYHVDAIPRLMAALNFSPSEARASSGRTRRAGDCPVDQTRLAADQAFGPTTAGPPRIH
jgi:transposase